MKAIRFVILAGILLTTVQLYAQKVKLVEGNLDALKDMAKLNVMYDYTRMTVGKFNNESDYIAYKKEEYDRLEAGRGDRWAKLWVEDRKNLFEPKFEEQFTKYTGVELIPGYDQQYTIILKTIYTEPGYNVAMWKKNAEVDAIVLIVESKNPAVIVAKIALDDCKGGIYDDNQYDPGIRLQEAYALAGKALGKLLKQKLQ